MEYSALGGAYMENKTYNFLYLDSIVEEPKVRSRWNIIKSFAHRNTLGLQKKCHE